MSILTVKFLDKDYSIPEDVLVYIDLLEFTDGVQKQLASTFVRKLKSEIDRGNIGCLDDKVMAPDIKQQVGKFIAKLTEYGIYDRTVNDYLRKNEGYKLISKVNAAALNEAKRALKQQMSDWLEGYEDAIQKKDASVTGLGFSIWSGSFVNHAIYAAMEASKVNEQEKAAAREYQKDMAELDARLESRKTEEETQYIANTYIPHMEAAITVFSYELLDTFISDLIQYGKLSKDVLDYIHIDRSNDLLNNLTLSNNKRVILENAFVACPYNIAVYMQAMKYDLLDYDSFQTAKIFKRDHLILSFFEESWGEVSFPTKFNINYHCINIWASLTEKQPEELLQGLTAQYATDIVKAYSRVTDMLVDQQLCQKVMGDCNEDAILAGDAICKTKAHSYVDTIVSSTIWCQLTEKCGYPDLLDHIKKCIPSLADTSTKEEFDKCLVEQLFSLFANERRVLADGIAKQREAEAARKAEQERQQQERRKRNKKIAAIVIPIAAVAIIFIIILNAVIIPSSKYNKAVELCNDGDYNAALSVFTEIEGYKDSANRMLECKCSLALELYNEGHYDDAKDILLSIQDYEDSNRLIGDCYMRIGDYQSAIAAYGTTEIIIPDGISHIKAEAFKGCDTLTSITIPASVISIGKGAFDDCESLVDVHISDLTKWCQIQFEDLTSSPMHYGDNLYLNGELLTDIVVPDNLTQINEYTFASWECLVNVQIGDNITDIDSWAFAFCDNLKNVTLPDTITSIKESTFNGCNSLADIIIPKSVEDIGENAFNDCNALINVVIPSNVDSIGKSAFAHCDNLTTFTFPDGIKTIEGYMFYPSESLQTVKIPNSVSSIGKWAFRNCLELTSIEFNGTVNEWKTITKEEEWDYEIGQYTVYCTDGQISAAQNAIFECDAGDVITFGAYEQDGNSNNGTEVIEWIVLDRIGDCALVISKYSLESLPFNNTAVHVTWANSTIREWLNQKFLNIAFSETEKSKICLSEINNPDDPDEKNTQGTTTDRVFLLSLNEAVKYFDSDTARETQATEYAVSHGNAAKWLWMLRSPGQVANMAYVTGGEIGYYDDVDHYMGIRPAMWIDVQE